MTIKLVTTIHKQGDLPNFGGWHSWPDMSSGTNHQFNCVKCERLFVISGGSPNSSSTIQSFPEFRLENWRIPYIASKRYTTCRLPSGRAIIQKYTTVLKQSPFFLLVEPSFMLALTDPSGRWGRYGGAGRGCYVHVHRNSSYTVELYYVCFYYLS